ncbi:MAG: monofunctional biosynthetic peptidoglycan transglycosylase [Myxococcaceae bacterium]|nr:monofunctional biosynthetic peptidoglycan transglycosylase [Myxococcaceae bacterium]
MKRAAEPSRWRRLARRLSRLTLGAFVALLAALLVLRVLDPPTTAFMLQRRLDAWRGDERRFSLRQQWVALEHIDPALQLAVVASEDQKFPRHSGFDVEAIADAVEDRFEGRSSRGASTLTQQVAKNLFLWPGQSFLRKGLEAGLTVLLELLWPKRRILEVYLNVAEFGDGVYGVEAACRASFGKSARHVTAEEAALLAAVLPAPKKRSVRQPSEVVKARAAWVVDQARALGPRWLDDVR